MRRLYSKSQLFVFDRLQIIIPLKIEKLDTSENLKCLLRNLGRVSIVRGSGHYHVPSFTCYKQTAVSASVEMGSCLDKVIYAINLIGTYFCLAIIRSGTITP